MEQLLEKKRSLKFRIEILKMVGKDPKPYQEKLDVVNELISEKIVAIEKRKEHRARMMRHMHITKVKEAGLDD